MKRIYVKGYFHGNLGDDLFLYIFLQRYRRAKIYIFADKKKYSELMKLGNLVVISSPNRIFNHIYNYYQKKGTRNILSKYCDFSILLGGSVFMEQYTDKNALIKRHQNVPYYILGANIGPYKTDQYLSTVRDVLKNSPDVCLRDYKSYSLVKDIPGIRYAPDIVWGLSDDKNGIIMEKQVIISVMSLENKLFSEKQIQFYNQVLDRIIRHYTELQYTIKAVAFCTREKDNDKVREIIKRFPTVQPLIYEGDIEKILKEFHKSEIVVATRFHAMLLGLLYEKKVIPLVYNEKMTSLLEDIHFTNESYDLIAMEKKNENSEYLKPNLENVKKQAEDHFIRLDQVINN